MTLIEQIIDQARWAPSGDNTQPWRFEIISENHFIVHGHDTRDHCVYDLEGRASQLSLGILLESIAIAASGFKNTVQVSLLEKYPETAPAIDIHLTQNLSLQESPLLSYLPVRSVQRRPLKITPLSQEEKIKLEQSIGDFYRVQWLEGWFKRWQTAWLLFKNGKLRLTLPEAFQTHSTIIEWNAQFSEDKIPDKAVGLDPVALKVMRWALTSWKRVEFLNTYFAGTLLPRVQMDLLPGLFCAAHFVLIAKQSPKNIEDYINAGRGVQRFWLTATQLGLQLQPEMTPLIFSQYIEKKIVFTNKNNLANYARILSEKFKELLSNNQFSEVVFLGRIGRGRKASARSLRLPLEKLTLLKK